MTEEKHLYVHRTRIHLNNKQESWMKGCAGFRRFAYNWALNAMNEVYSEGGRLTPAEADKAFNAAKKDEFPWVYDYPSCVGQEAIKADLKSAFDGFYRRVKRGETPGFPRFKSKHRSADSFCLSNGVVKDKHFDGNHLILPKKMGRVRLGDTPRWPGRLLSTTISRQGSRWYAALLYELPEPLNLPVAKPGAVGVDLGIAQRATLSGDEEPVFMPEEIKRLQERMKWLQRKLAKLQGPDKRLGRKASRSWLKLNARINDTHRKIANIRNTSAHELTARLSKEYSVIAIEDLKLSNMTKSAKGTKEAPGKNVKAKSGLNREMMNVGAYEIRRQLEYKTIRHYGILLAVNPRHTSQTCYSCGHVSKLNRKSQSRFNCVQCGYTDNADRNAANNILRLGLEELAGESCSG